jgi:hypothetical protein
MKKDQLIFIIVCLLLWPVMSWGEENKGGCNFNSGLSDHCFFTGVPDNREVDLTRAKKELTTRQLDSITAGGLENIAIMTQSHVWITGKIILWDELGCINSSKYATGSVLAMPGNHMKRVQINAVFVGNE